MSMDDTMRLTAELVDKYSGPLKQMQAKLKEMSATAKSAHETSAKATREHAHRVKELHERMGKMKATISDALTPALASMGITGLAAGEAIGKLADKLRAAGESYYVFNDIAKRGAVSAGYVDAITVAFQRLGIAPEQAMSSVANLGEHLDKIASHNPDELNSLTSAFGNMGTSLRMALEGATGREDAMKRIFSFMGDHPNVPVWQKRKWLEALGIDPALATRSGAELREAFEKGFEFERKHPVDLKLFKSLDEAFAHLREAQTGYWDDMVKTFGPAGVKIVNTFADAIERVGKMQRNVWSDREVPVDKRSLFGRLSEKLGLHATGSLFGADQPNARVANDFADLDEAKKQEEATAKGTKQGVLDAIREMSAAQSFAGGYTPMAFHPDEGGVGAARRAFHSGGGFRVLNGDAGSGLPGAPAEGSNADKGVGGVDLGAGTGMSGSEYLKARRERFAKELRDNPHVRDEVKGMMATEGTPQHSLEALMNRMDFMGGSLHGGLHSGFYGPINHGKLPGAIAELHRNAKRNKQYDAVIDRVLNGSDAIKGFTDQGMPTDPNGHLRAPGHAYMHVHGNDFTDWVGPKGREAARRFREAQERAVNAPPVSTAHASLKDHIRHHGSLLQNDRRSSLDRNPIGHAKVSVDFSGMPKGTRTKASATGLFKEVELNRGKPMVMSSSDG